MAAAGMPFSMAAAGMTLFVMVMIAVRTGRYEFAIQIRFCSFIRISMHSGTKFHTRFIKCRLCSAADSSIGAVSSSVSRPTRSPFSM